MPRTTADLIEDGELLDVTKRPQNAEGDFILTEQDLKDYRNFIKLDTSEWIYSVGRNIQTQQVLASTSNKFKNNPAFELVWRR